MSMPRQRYRNSAILSDAAHLFVWILWLVICAGGLLKLHDINPELSGWRLGMFYGLQVVAIVLLVWDLLRLGRTDEAQRKLWPSLLIRIVSVLALIAVAGILFAPAFRRIYGGDV